MAIKDISNNLISILLVVVLIVWFGVSIFNPDLEKSIITEVFNIAAWVFVLLGVWSIRLSIIDLQNSEDTYMSFFRILLAVVIIGYVIFHYISI